MAIYDFNPNRFGINFLSPGIEQGSAGLLSGLLQRQDPRNIEIRRTWADPSKHMTPFGWAQGTPAQVTSGFDVVGGFLQATDASGNPILDPTTGQPVLKWDQRYQRKGSPIPPGYQILSDPYKQFPGSPAKKENSTPPPFMGMAGLPPVLSPLRMESGGKVPEQNPLQALITLLEIEHKKTKKGEVPAILHKGEGVVTKKGMKVLDNMVGGIDNLNSLGESLPKMEKGGEVTDEKGIKWTMVKDNEGRIIWLPANPTEGLTPFNETPKKQTVIPPKDGSLVQNDGQLYWRAYSPYPSKPGKKEETKTTKAEKEKPTQKNPVEKTPVSMVQPTPKTIPAKQGYRDWNAPSQFSFGQLSGMDPLQAMGVIQADVEGRGIPPLQPVYGAQGQVLPQQTIAEQRIARQGELANQYMAGLQGQAAKVQMDWYPKEAKARIDQINSQIAYNNEMLKRSQAAGGLSPDDMLKLAQIDKINSELAINKIGALESALKMSDKMDKKSRQLLAIEYMITKYPTLAEVSPKDLINYLETNKVNILGIKFDRITPLITDKDVALVVDRVSGNSPITSGVQPGNSMTQIQSEYNNQPGQYTVTPSPGTTTPIMSNLLNMQNKLVNSGVIK